MKRKPLKRSGFQYVGTLPVGDWKFCLVQMQGQADVIVLADLTGENAPRMLIDGKLVTLECS